MRKFGLYQRGDIGSRRVADGIQFTNGSAAVHWIDKTMYYADNPRLPRVYESISLIDNQNFTLVWDEPIVVIFKETGEAIDWFLGLEGKVRVEIIRRGKVQTGKSLLVQVIETATGLTLGRAEGDDFLAVASDIRRQFVNKGLFADPENG